MSGGLTRRAFARRALAGAAAALVPPLWHPAGAMTTVPASGAHRLRKCISMGGFGPLSQPGHPQDVRLYGNREYIRDLSGTRWVKLWVSWRHLQEEFAPASRAESWAQLGSAPGGAAALRILDAQVAALNADALRTGGMGVILTLYHETPTWAGSGRAGAAGKPVDQRLPDDLSPGGPWAWFIGYLMARYRRGAPRNPLGPREPGLRDARLAEHDPRAGNPDGAVVDALEICNEPNLLAWPQRGLPARVGDMVESAAVLAAASDGPLVLVPATADGPDPPHSGERATDWRTFTSAVLAELSHRDLPAPVAWSHHNYRDVTDGVSRADSRAREVIALLDRAGWRGAGGPRLWLTEGGVNLGARVGDARARARQAALIERNFTEMAAEPEVFVWTQHTINDVAGNTYRSGLRDDFRPGVGPGPARPAWDTWRGLPGSPVR